MGNAYGRPRWLIYINTRSPWLHYNSATAHFGYYSSLKVEGKLNNYHAMGFFPSGLSPAQCGLGFLVLGVCYVCPAKCKTRKMR